MKTTLEIPDSTLRRAKTLAAAKALTLKQLFTEALEDKLRQSTRTAKIAGPLWMKLAGAFGKTSADRAETQRIQKLIDEEFERIEAEDGQ